MLRRAQQPIGRREGGHPYSPDTNVQPCVALHLSSVCIQTSAQRPRFANLKALHRARLSNKWVKESRLRRVSFRPRDLISVDEISQHHPFVSAGGSLECHGFPWVPTHDFQARRTPRELGHESGLRLPGIRAW